MRVVLTAGLCIRKTTTAIAKIVKAQKHSHRVNKIQLIAATVFLYQAFTKKKICQIKVLFRIIHSFNNLRLCEKYLLVATHPIILYLENSSQG